MSNLQTIRALLVEADAGRAVLARSLLDEASAGQVELVHLDDIGPALARLAVEPFDVVLFGLVPAETFGEGHVGSFLVQAPDVPVVVLALLAQADLELAMIRYGAQDFWVGERDTGQALLRAIRCAIERKPRLSHLVQQANYDQLTGLPNRWLFEDRLAHAAARARRESSPLALLFLDMDGFKQVNDRLGHFAGDHVLRRVAERVQSVVRESDTLARIGGDEFAIVLEGLARVEDASTVAQKVINVLSAPFIESNHRFDLTCSIGISYYLLDGTDARSLLDHADEAMYRAKRLGGNRYLHCTEDFGPQALNRFNLVSALWSGLEHQRFELYFQPQVELPSGAVRGVEALLRWHHPEQGLLGPETFIEVAEDSNVIAPLDEWVLRRACQELRLWQDAGLPVPRMAINLSPRQVIKPGLGTLVATVLKETGLLPAQLEFEVKEAVLYRDFKASAATLGELKDLGTRLALNDFGNGHSAVSYLRRLPLDTIKLDRSLIRQLGGRGTEQVIARSFVELAHNLAISVVAIGVETEAQLSFLHEAGCDAVQGYLLSPPLDGKALSAWLRCVPCALPLDGDGPPRATRT